MKFLWKDKCISCQHYGTTHIINPKDDNELYCKGNRDEATWNPDEAICTCIYNLTTQKFRKDYNKYDILSRL